MRLYIIWVNYIYRFYVVVFSGGIKINLWHVRSHQIIINVNKNNLQSYRFAIFLCIYIIFNYRQLLKTNYRAMLFTLIRFPLYLN